MSVVNVWLLVMVVKKKLCVVMMKDNGMWGRRRWYTFCIFFSLFFVFFWIFVCMSVLLGLDFWIWLCVWVLIFFLLSM
jgi:hypothetical protein